MGDERALVGPGAGTPAAPGQHSRHGHPAGQVQLAQGEEMGRFLLGSTVVLLLPEAAPGWNAAWQAGGPVRMGHVMAGAD